MPHKIEAWKCDYCNKVTIACGSTTAHEAYCKKNPKNKYCQTCSKCYYKHVTEDIGATIPYVHDVMWCKQYDKPIYEKPYYEECETNDYYGAESQPIPCTCWEYEQRIAEEGAER